MQKSSRPIFHDRKGHRSRVTNAFLGVGGILAAVGVCVVVLGVMFGPELPPLQALQYVKKSETPASQIIPPQRSEPITAWRQKSAFNKKKITRLGFISPNDNGSMASLQLNATKLDAIVFDCLELERTSDAIRLNPVKECEQLLNWTAESAPGVGRYFMLSDYTAGASLFVANITTDQKRKSLISELLQFMREYKVNGIALDVKNVPLAAHRNLMVFLHDLREQLSVDDGAFILVVDPEEDGVRLQQLARIADYVIVEAHDNTLSRSDIGPVASQGWFESRTSKVASKIDRDKLIIGIGSYGYEWKHGLRQRVSVQYVWDKVATYGGQIQFDPHALNPTYHYYSDNVRKDFWYLDAVTAFNHMRAAITAKPAGIMLWRIGLEDPGVWSFFERDKFPEDTEVLKRIETGTGAFESVRGGALLTINPDKDQVGERELTYDQSSGLITQQILRKVPQKSISISQYGQSNKEVVLTFDDGPSEKYTEQVLDILKAKKVPGTFYVIGANALAHPRIMRRIFDEGHEIGNHSFSHPNVFTAGRGRVIAELNATQRVIESTTGVSTILFRPPYIDSDYWRLDESPILVKTASELGYVFAGWDADPVDYLPFGTVQNLVQRAITQVDHDGGRILLLHDAGGDRKRTVEALPLIIDELQARGYTIVTTAKLVGMARDVVMPPVKAAVANGVEHNARTATFSVAMSVGSILPMIGISTAILGTIRVILIAIGAFIHRRRERTRPWRKSTPSTNRITVLVPAYNEEKVICKTVDTLLASTIRDRLDILVVDDGSSDATTEIVRTTYAGCPSVKVHRKPNGGKASALNVGIQLAQSDIIVAIDGDTMLRPDAIELLIDRLESDPALGAVAGSVLVGNAVSFITRCQSLEYITSQHMDRRAFELINAIGVVPGCIGAWRKQALIEAGGYSTTTLAEDADLTITIERLGWKVASEPRAIAMTEAPETLRAFMKQRFRWTFGMLQVACKHARALLSFPRGISWTVFNIFSFQIALSLFAPVFDLMLAYSLLSMVMGFDIESAAKLVIYWLIFQSIDLAAASVGLLINGEKAPWRLLPLLLLQRFSYRQLLYIVTIRAVLAAVKGHMIGWGKLIRTGTVKLYHQGER